MDNQNKRPEWVQLELFPEMNASKGGEQSVTNKSSNSQWIMNFAALAYLTAWTMKRPALESARLRIVRYASANKVA